MTRLTLTTPRPIQPASESEGQPAGQKQRDPLRVAVRAEWRNDQFYVENGDDNGLTNDGSLGVEVQHGQRSYALDADLRMLTERGGMRRTDQLDLVAAFGQEFTEGPLTLRLRGTAGASVVGDLGGAELQDGFHGLINMGRRLSGWLQDEYEGDTRGAFLVGADVALAYQPADQVRLHGRLEGQAAIGDTGLSFVRPSLGVDLQTSGRGFRPFVAAELATTFYSTVDERLEMPGGYGTAGAEFTPRFRAGVRTNGFEFGYEGRANEGGSGANMGSLYLRYTMGK